MDTQERYAGQKNQLESRRIGRQVDFLGPKGQSDQGHKNGNQNKGHKRKAPSGDGVSGVELVAATGKGKRCGSQKQDCQWTPHNKLSFDEILDKPCVIHSTEEGQAGHTTRQCRVLKKIQSKKHLPQRPMVRMTHA